MRTTPPGPLRACLGLCLALTAYLCTGLRVGAEAQAALTGTPLQPLLAWAVADDGAVYVLDASSSIFELDVETLAPLRRSAPLAQAISAEPSHLAVTAQHVVVGGPALNGSVVLSRDALTAVTTLDRAGPMAVDDARLFMIADDGVWRYDLAAATGDALLVAAPPPTRRLGWLPTGLAVDRANRWLHVRSVDGTASPPHRTEKLSTYSLDTLALEAEQGGYLGHLSMPSADAHGRQSVSALSALNGLSSSKLLTWDSAGNLVAETPYLSGQAALDPSGDWLYLLRGRGLWVLDFHTQELVSVLPFPAGAPAALHLAPDGALVYLFGNGWLTALPSASLQALGIAPVHPFPNGWSADPREARAHVAPQFAQNGTAFVLGADGELYRSRDHGRTWLLLPHFSYPSYQPIQQLSLSPTFTADQTVIARTVGGLQRSTDGGDTWSAWSPRVALTSARDGNREIYHVDSHGEDWRRLTNHPAADENPAWSPGWTHVVFQSNRNGNWDLYQVRATCDVAQSGGGAECDLRQLTADPADDLLPAWSPDGRRIAFVSTRDGNPEIYVMEADGQNVRRLTVNPSGDWRPAWLPDSRHLLITSDRNGTNDLFLLEVPPANSPTTHAEPEIVPLVATPADERDAAVNAAGDVLFLSDRDGVLRVYAIAAWQVATGEPVEEPYLSDYNRAAVAGGHPAWLDEPSGAQVLMAVVDKADGDSDIVRTPFLSLADHYVPLAATAAFDGQPAGSPTWWSAGEFMPIRLASGSALR